MVHSGLKIFWKSVAIAGRYLTPLFLLAFITLSNVLDFNEFKVSKFIFEGLCNNENMDGLGRIVCPVVSLEDPFLKNDSISRPENEINLPLLISTTQLKNNVVINADSSTPSSLYLILEVCNNYNLTNPPKLRLLEDLCVIIKESTEESDIKYKFNKNASKSNQGKELIKWRNVTSLLQRLPSSGKLPHIKLLSSMNKSKILSKVLKSLSSYQEGHDTCQNGFNNGHTDLLITSDRLTTSENPFKLLAESALPNLAGKSFGTVQDSIYRLFLSFPEASAALLHMRRMGFKSLDFQFFEPQIDRFTFLSVFLSSIQLLLTYSFESVDLYKGIVESSYRSKTVYEKFRYSYLLKEFTKDLESKVFVENIINKLSSFVINLNLKNRLFTVGDIGLGFTKKFLSSIITMNEEGKNLNIANVIAKKLGECLVSLGKFISFDFNNDGLISFEEFTKGSIDMNNFVNDVINAVDSYNQGETEKEEDSTLQFVNLLKSQNTLYDKIIDEFIISDTDKNDSLSLDEFMELTLSTSVIETIHA